MIDEADGYVTDVAYTRHHHPTLDPARALLAARRAGLEPPPMQHACELGFGQGLSLAIHATASDTEWWGVDVLPQHVEFARSLIDDAAARERLVCASFEQFDARSDLPTFDFIALHGVWSWISPENRARITTFIDRRLAPGGIVYLGYNALPGWGPALSLRELLVAYANRPGSDRLPIEERIEQALIFATQVIASEPRIIESQPAFERQLRDIRSKKKSYLAHEYFNRDWHPMHFSQVSASLSRLGLRYLGQADFSDSYDEWRLTAAQRAVLSQIDDPLLYETTRDLMLNRRFRRDYWLRSEATPIVSRLCNMTVRLQIAPGPRPNPIESPAEVLAWLDALGAPGSHVTRSIETASDHAALAYAIGRGWVNLARASEVAASFRASVGVINARILDRVFDDPELGALASHWTGSGIELGWWTLALLAAMRDGQGVEVAVKQVLSVAERLGIALSRNGFELSEHEAMSELRCRADALLAQRALWSQVFAY